MNLNKTFCHNCCLKKMSKANKKKDSLTLLPFKSPLFYKLFCVAHQIQNKMTIKKKLHIERGKGGAGGVSLGETRPKGGLRAKGDVRRQGEGGYPKK